MESRSPATIEKAITDLLYELKETRPKRERDASLARIACAAVEALPCKPTPGQRDVARERFDWPVLVSLNRSIGLLTRKQITDTLNALQLGKAHPINIKNASWGWNTRTRLVARYIALLHKARKRLRARPKNNFYSEPGDELKCGMESIIRSLPKFGRKSWKPWLDAIMLDLRLAAGVGPVAAMLNATIEGAKLHKAAAKYDEDMLKDGLLGPKDAVILKSEIREPLRKAVQSLAGVWKSRK